MLDISGGRVMGAIADERPFRGSQIAFEFTGDEQVQYFSLPFIDS